MNKVRLKITKVLSFIFGVGILIALFVGALSFVGYLIALIIGGDTATQICTIIYKNVYPVLFSFTSIIVLLGLVKMYVAGEKAMVPKKQQANKTLNVKEKEIEKENNDIKQEEQAK